MGIFLAAPRGRPALLLSGVRRALAPGGVLVVVELAALPRFLSDPRGVLLEQRCHAAAAAEGWNYHPDYSRAAGVECGVYLRSISDGIDPTTTSGRLMLNMLATLAEYERELIVERVNAGIAAARQGGTRFGRPLSDPLVIAEKLAIASDARARLVGWSRASLYRHQQAASRL